MINMGLIGSWWNWFFHARAGDQACVLSGWIRIGYASLILFDRLLLSLDFHWLFFEVMPYEATSKHSGLLHSYSLFALAPESPMMYYGLHWLGVVQALLLLLGVAPRFQVACLHVNMISFHYHNLHIWDGEDLMFRMWNFHMLFLPLHRVTIWEWLDRKGYTNTSKDAKPKTNKKEEKNESSWPMWPFRLFQITMCNVYIGAGIAKLANERWQNGLAMWHIAHANDFFGGAWTPDFLYNQLGPLMFLSYSSLALEATCFVLIWPKATRMATLVSMIALHIGIELAMNMHCFEWLSILGWLMFLVEEPERKDNENKHPALVTEVIENEESSSNGNNNNDNHNNSPTSAATNVIETKESSKGNVSPTSCATQDYGATTTAKTKSDSPPLPPPKQPDTKNGRFLLNLFLVTVLSLFLVDSIPLYQIEALIPGQLFKDVVGTLADQREIFVDEVISPLLTPIGLHQGVWSMFCEAPDGCFRYEAFVRFANDTEVSWLNLGVGASNMTWYEKKRWQRPLSYYDNFDKAAHDPLTRYIARLYGPDVISVDLWLHTDMPPEYPPDDLGWFGPARSERERESEYLFTLNICDDMDDVCEEWADEGLCDDDEKLVFMTDRCRKSCNICYGVEDIVVGSRVWLLWAGDGVFYSATVKEIQEKPRKYLLDYDQYDEGEQFEWIDGVSLRKRRFRFFDDNEVDDEGGGDEDDDGGEDEDEGDDGNDEYEEAYDNEGPATHATQKKQEL